MLANIGRKHSLSLDFFHKTCHVYRQLIDIWRTSWLDHFDGKPPETIRDTLKLIVNYFP